MAQPILVIVSSGTDIIENKLLQTGDPAYYRIAENSNLQHCDLEAADLAITRKADLDLGLRTDEALVAWHASGVAVGRGQPFHHMDTCPLWTEIKPLLQAASGERTDINPKVCRDRLESKLRNSSGRIWRHAIELLTSLEVRRLEWEHGMWGPQSQQSARDDLRMEAVKDADLFIQKIKRVCMPFATLVEESLQSIDQKAKIVATSLTDDAEWLDALKQLRDALLGSERLSGSLVEAVEQWEISQRNTGT